MLSPDVVRRLAAGEDIVVQVRPNQVEAVTLLYATSEIYLYDTRNAGSSSFSNVEREQKVIADYDLFAAQSRALQLRFNVALFVGSLLLVGIAVYIALAVADWMVRPVNELVTAARRITTPSPTVRIMAASAARTWSAVWSPCMAARLAPGDHDRRLWSGTPASRTLRSTTGDHSTVTDFARLRGLSTS